MNNLYKQNQTKTFPIARCHNIDFWLPWDVRFDSKFGKFDTKWDKYGTFSDQISEHFGAREEAFGANLTQFGARPDSIF